MLSASEKILLERLLHRDETAFRFFYENTKERLLKYLSKYLDTEDAEEVLHDSYISFIEGLRNFRSQSSLKTYLYSIAKRKAIDKIRRQRVKKILFSYLPDNFIESVAKVFLKDDIDKKFLAYHIEKVLKKLPHDYALVLRLKYKEGYSVVDIATHTKLSFKATESLLFRARQAFIIAYNRHERQTVHTIEEALR